MALLTILAVLLLTGPRVALAQAVVRIIEKGVYQAETTSRTVTDNATGIRNTVRDPRQISDSTIIYARLGLRFGVRYLVSGTAETPADLQLIINFPPAGLRDSKTGALFFQSQHRMNIPAGVIQYWEYHFENEWEIVPGLWQFEFWSGNKALAVQRFCVIDLRQDSKNIARPRECLPALLGSSARQQGKITIKHGPIKKFEMDEGMTMVFRVEDPVMLKSVKAGDEIKFDAERIKGQFTVTKIEKAK